MIGPLDWLPVLAVMLSLILVALLLVVVLHELGEIRARVDEILERTEPEG